MSTGCSSVRALSVYHRLLGHRLLGHRLLAATLACCALACGPITNDGGGDGVDGGDSTADASAGQPDAADNGIDAAPPPDNSAVYAHSSSSLYRIDPNTLEVTLVGSFIWPLGADSMTDIAIDRFGRMVGVSFTRVYEIDEQTGSCIFLSDLVSGGFNGLSFVPSSADPAQEILIGANTSGEVYQIDLATGAATIIGIYGNGYGSSGDIVSVLGAGTFATVTGAGASDSLAQIDPDNGYAATIIGDTGYTGIWGLGYWRNKVYGFSSNNEFLVMDVNTGQATPEQVDSISWWGAGVTTLAPIIE